MLPIYHPTTTILVDDVQSYLDAVTEAAPYAQPVLPFVSPEKAIAHIREQNKVAQASFEKLMRITGDTDRVIVGNRAVQDQIIRLSISSLPEKLSDPRRFNEVSVVVCDYAMPSMKGTDFFEKLGPIPQKRILLTGEADETIAVQAFNDGLIDQFVTKGQQGAVKRLYSLVRRYQRDYFRQQYSFLLSRFWNNDSIFARPGFEKLIQMLHEDGFLEHYYVHFPDGAVMIGDRFKRLVAMHDDDYEALIDIVRDSDAPDREFIDALEARQVVVNEGQGNGMIGDFTDWRSMVLPAMRFENDGGTLYYALFEINQEVDLRSAALFQGSVDG